MKRILIVGAGLAGLTAARLLAQVPDHPEVIVVDKGRSVGGRLATRRLGGATLDHGAQFFTVRSKSFQGEVDRWIEAGVVEEWCRGFSPPDGYPRYRAVGGMNALAKHLAETTPTPTLTRLRVSAIIPGPDQWAVAYEAASREPDEVDAVIATPPVPQTLKLLKSGAATLSSELGDQLEAMTYHKVIAIMAVLDRSPGLIEPGALQQPDNSVFTFVADNQAKGISDEPAVTFHLSHDLSAELWELSDGEVLARVEHELRSTINQASVNEIDLKRWRYAGPVTPHPDLCLVAMSKPGPLVFAGDGFGNSKVEGAFLSGQAAARQVLADLELADLELADLELGGLEPGE